MRSRHRLIQDDVAAVLSSAVLTGRATCRRGGVFVVGPSHIRSFGGGCFGLSRVAPRRLGLRVVLAVPPVEVSRPFEAILMAQDELREMPRLLPLRRRDIFPVGRKGLADEIGHGRIVLDELWSRVDVVVVVIRRSIRAEPGLHRLGPVLVVIRRRVLSSPESLRHCALVDRAKTCVELFGQTERMDRVCKLVDEDVLVAVGVPGKPRRFSSPQLTAGRSRVAPRPRARRSQYFDGERSLCSGI